MSGCQWGDMWWLYKSSAVFQATGSEHKPVDPGAGYQTLPGKKEEKPSGSFYYGHFEVVNSTELRWEAWASHLSAFVLISWYLHHSLFHSFFFLAVFDAEERCVPLGRTLSAVLIDSISLGCLTVVRNTCELQVEIITPGLKAYLI